MNSSQLVDIAFKVYNHREQKKAQAFTIFLEQASGKSHQWARGAQPLSKCLPLINAHIAKQKGTGKISVPSTGRQGQRA